MRHGDVMKDPFYAGIVFEIERKITEGDQIAKSRGFVLTDSQVISILTKVLGAANGKPAKIPAASNPRDVFLGEWFTQLKDVREGILEATEGQNTAGPLQTADWVQSLHCVIESARLRKGTVPGSRHYLDFLGPFIEQATRR
jgi:hypothetical protein